MGRWFEEVLAHLTLDSAWVMARTTAGQTFSGEVDQEPLAKRGKRLGCVRWARGMARRRTRSAPVKLS